MKLEKVSFRKRLFEVVNSNGKKGGEQIDLGIKS